MHPIPGLIAGGVLALAMVGGTWAATEPASWPSAATVTPAGADPSAKFYLLTFADRDVNEVAAEVLGGVLKMPFQVDPGVMGRISFQVEERLTPGQLLEAFGAALRPIGATIVNKDGAVLVTTAARAEEVSTLVERQRKAEPVAAVTPPAPSVERVDRSAQFNAWGILGGFVLCGALGGVLVALRYSPAFAATGFAPRKKRLGRERQAVLDRLVGLGAVQPDALARAQATDSRRPVEHQLNQSGDLSDEALVEAYAAVTGCGVWSPEDEPSLSGPAAAPFEAMRRRGLIPIRCGDKTLTLAMSDPLDDRAIAEAAVEAGRTVFILAGKPADIRRASQGPPMLIAHSA